jgi:hypothetical protein
VASIGATGVIAGLQFNGSGAGLTTGTIPDAALVTAPVTSVLGGTGITSSGGTTPTVGITASGVGQTQVANGYVDLSSAQTVNGAKTFSSNVGASSFSAGSSVYGPSAADVFGTLTTHSGNPGVLIDTTGQYGLKFINQDSGGVTACWFPGESASYPNVLELSNCSNRGMFQFNVTNGNLNTVGSITAANFYNGSRREWKKNIKPFNFDPLAVLKATDFAQYDCSDIRCGPIGTHKIGFIANDTPAVLSGPKHDHFDAAALATVNSAAILQLTKKIDKLTFVLHALCLQPQNRGVAECAALSQ